jgi:hypothetical protein
LSAGLERGGAVNDEHEKNPALDTSAVFQLLTRLLYPNRLPLKRTRKMGVE